MTQIPVSLFPLSKAAAKPGAFVALVLIGLTLYLATRPRQQSSQP